MGRNFNHRVFFPALAILAALLRQPVVAAVPSDAGEGRVEKTVVTRLRAGVTGAGIQQALDSLPDAGGEVILPAGDIRISRPIVLRRDNQSLCGEGLATILRLTDSANCPVIIMGEPVDQPKSTVKHLLVSGVCIDGNRRHQQSELWRMNCEGSEIHNNGITVQDVADSEVEDVICAHCRSGGLVTTLGVQRLAVENFEAFDNEFDGLACYLTTNCRFANLYLHDNCSAGISLDLAFDHNCVTGAVLSGNDLGIFMRDSRDNQFQYISIHRSRHFGVFIAQSDIETPQGWQPVAHGECVDNRFMNLNVANCGSAAFHINDPTCTNNVVMDMPAGVAFRGGPTPNKFE